LVFVGPRANADTFGFSLGTNGSSYTTIFGARAGDHVTAIFNAGPSAIFNAGPGAIFNASILANHIAANGSTNAMSLAQFISDLGPLHSGNTYIGSNGSDTFIVTDFYSHVGAIDIVGSFTTSSIAGHVLTLHA
jgi:hypothetical protein